MDAKETIAFLQASYPSAGVFARRELHACRTDPTHIEQRCDVAIVAAINGRNHHSGTGETFNEAVSDLLSKCPPPAKAAVVLEGREAA